MTSTITSKDLKQVSEHLNSSNIQVKIPKRVPMSTRNGKPLRYMIVF